jgi:hypothetical protein
MKPRFPARERHPAAMPPRRKPRPRRRSSNADRVGRPMPIFDEGIKFRLSNVTKLDMELSAVSREFVVRVGAVRKPASSSDSKA